METTIILYVIIYILIGVIIANKQYQTLKLYPFRYDEPIILAIIAGFFWPIILFYYIMRRIIGSWDCG